VGYCGIFFKKLYVDIDAYFNRYFHFIGDIRFFIPTGDSVEVGGETGADAALTGAYRYVQMPTNASQHVDAWGASIGLNYYLWKSLAASFNYTYSDLNTKNLTDPILPGFNTPKHKFNVGISATKLWKGLGFGMNFRWAQGFNWESTFGDGEVPTWHALDAQLQWEFEKWFTLQVGGSNIYNNKHIEAYGSPQIGALVYGSMLFDLERNNKKNK
jgi:outer membrane receptor protein involved in Fe transport